MATLASAPRASLAQDTLDRLRRAILGGELPPGAPLPEASTAAKLGVSRVPVREALVQLERQGLVEFDASGRGSVRRFSAEDVQEILSLRAALQALAARRAAENAGPRDIARLKELVEKTRGTLDLSELSALDAAFHDEIVAVARHQRLARAWADLRAQMALWLARAQRRRESLKHDVRDATFRAHRDFLAILARRDPERAARCMESHCFSWEKEPLYLSEDA